MNQATIARLNTPISFDLNRHLNAFNALNATDYRTNTSDKVKRIANIAEIYLDMVRMSFNEHIAYNRSQLTNVSGDIHQFNGHLLGWVREANRFARSINLHSADYNEAVSRIIEVCTELNQIGDGMQDTLANL